MISCVFILFTCNDDQKISLYSSEPIHISLLQEEHKMQEVQLNIDGTNKGDCKKPEETFTEG